MALQDPTPVAAAPQSPVPTLSQETSVPTPVPVSNSAPVSNQDETFGELLKQQGFNKSLDEEMSQQQEQELINNLVPIYGFGDVNTFVPINNDDADGLDKFAYGFYKNKSLLGNAWTASQAAFNTIMEDSVTDSYMAPSEIFGIGEEEWHDIPYNERVKMIRDREDADLRAKYPEAAAAFDRDEAGFAGGLGAFIAMAGIESLIALPASMTGSVAKMATFGAGFSGAYSVSDDLGSGRDVSFARAAVSTGIGAVAAGTLTKGFNVYSAKKAAKLNLFREQGANKIIDDANVSAALARTQAKTKEEAIEAKDKVPDMVEQMFGHTREIVNEAKAATGRQVLMPRTAEEAQTVIRVTRDAAEELVKTKGKTRQLTERLLIPVLNVIENYSPKIALDLNKSEMNRSRKLFNMLSGEKDRKAIARANRVDKKDANVGVKDYMASLKKLSDEDAFKVFVFSRNGDMKGITNILAKKIGAEKAAAQVKNARRIIDDMEEDLSNVFRYKTPDGRATKAQQVGSATASIFKKRINYMPSLVKDYNGLMKAIGSDRRIGATRMRSMQDKFLEHHGAKTLDDIPQEEVSSFLTRVALGDVPDYKGGRVFSTEARTISTDDITPNLFKYYERTEDALYKHITKSVDLTEQANFLGLKNLAFKQDKNKNVLNVIDVEESLKRKFNTEAPALPASAFDAVNSVISSRYGMGQQSPSGFVKFVRDLGYIWTLANPFSALIQLSDVGLAMWSQGIINTFRGILSKKEFDMLDYGLADTIQSIATDPRDLSKTLNFFMKYSGFQKMDRIGKNVYMNATWQNVKRQAQTKAGVDKLARRYKTAYGDEFDSMISALKKGDTSDENVKLLIWNELSDAQPISLSKTPQASLDNPNGRVLYSLKMFMINQLNFVGRKTFKAIRSQDPAVRAEGYKSMAMLLPTVAFVGASVSEMRSYLKNGMEGFEITNFDERMGEFALKMIGASYYTIDQLQRGDIVGAAGNYATLPAFSFFKDVYEGVVNEEFDSKNSIVTGLPVVGGLIDILANDVAGDVRREASKFRTAEENRPTGLF